MKGIKVMEEYGMTENTDFTLVFDDNGKIITIICDNNKTCDVLD